jgi:hypothetical protein
VSVATPTKVHPIRTYLARLDSTDYPSKAEMLKAARELRQVDVDAHKADMKARADHTKEIKAEQKQIKKEQDKRKFPTMAQRRHAVRHGTHRWCSWMGLGGCHNTGYLKGRVPLKHARCGGEGVISIRGRRKRR